LYCCEAWWAEPTLRGAIALGGRELNGSPEDPLPSPPPEYWERGPEGACGGPSGLGEGECACLEWGGRVSTVREQVLTTIRTKIVATMGPAVGDVDTLLAKIRGVHNLVTPEEYIRMVSISRIMLPNIKNIQASWLTVGKQTAQVCLHAGANDFGSIMIEENVVSAAGAPHRFTYKSMQDAIKEAGFVPQLRNQQYEWREIPETIEEQVVNY